MRIPNEEHVAQPWRIHGLIPDFTLEDVWAMPEITGRRDEFGAFIRQMRATDPSASGNLAARTLWKARDLLGKWLGLGEVLLPDGQSPAPFPDSVSARLPDDLAGTARLAVGRLPFVPVYQTTSEFVAEISNRTVHGVMHVGWALRGDGSYSPQMAVYVKPNGRLGAAYMNFIWPFRYLVVYPAMEREAARRWRQRTP